MHDNIHEEHIDLASAFRAHGVQLTTQRRAIWEFYSSCSRGVTISEAIDALRASGVGQATVYRATLLLQDAGLLHRIQMPDGQVCFVASKSEHSHPLICRSCRGVVEFDTCDLSVLEKLLHAQTGYEIEGHQLEVYGICPKCKQCD